MDHFGSVKPNILVPPQNGARVSLEELPGVSAETFAMEARLLQEYLRWCNSTLTVTSAEDIFVRVPQFAAQSLRSYGDLWFQQGKSLSNFSAFGHQFSEMET